MKRLYRVITAAQERRFIRRGFVPTDHQIDGKSLRIYEAPGRGSLGTIVCFHGLSSEAPELAPLLVRLQESFSKVVGPDLPGHGHSALWEVRSGTWLRPLFGALERHIDGPVTAFGNSLGGYVALRWYGHSPKRLARMFLSSPGGAATTKAQAAAFREGFTFRSRADADRFVGKLLARPPWYRPLMAAMIQTRFARPEVRVLVDAITPENMLAAHAIESIGIPTMLEWGQDDRIQPAHQLAFFEAHRPSTMTITKPAGVGHCPYLEDARAFAGRIASFACA